MNREAFGAETDIFCRMGLIAPDGSTIYVHPTFLYESLWNLCILIFLIIFERKGKRSFDGQCITLYFLLYGIGRTWIEGCAPTAFISAQPTYVFRRGFQ